MNLTAKKIAERLHDILNSEDNSPSLAHCCEDICEMMNQRKKDDADAMNIRFVTAAALVTYGRYLQRSHLNSCDINTFKAGDIDIHFKSDNGFLTAENLIKTALADIADLLKDDGFAFFTV